MLEYNYDGYGFIPGPAGMVTLNDQLAIEHDAPKDVDIKLNEIDQFVQNTVQSKLTC